MKTRTLMILILALAVLGGVAYVMQTKSPAGASGSGGVNAGDPLADFNINDTAKVTVSRPDGSQSLSLSTNGTWLVDSLHGYPADGDKLVEILRKVAQLEVDEVRADGKDYLDDFGLGTNATRLVLADAAGRELTTLVLGENREGGAGRFALAGQEVVLIEEGFGQLPSDDKGWIKKELIEVPAADLSRVEVTTSNGTCVVNMTGGSNYEVEGIQETEQVNSGNAGRLSRALQYLSFSELAEPGQPDVELGLAQPATFKASTTDGRVYTVQVGSKIDDKYYARLSAAFVEPAAPEKAEGQSDEDHKKALETHTKSVAEAKTKVDEANRHAKWTYALTSYNGESLILDRAKLVEAKPAPEPPTPGPVIPGPAQPDPKKSVIIPVPPPEKPEPPKQEAPKPETPVEPEAPAAPEVKKVEPPKPPSAEAKEVLKGTVLPPEPKLPEVPKEPAPPAPPAP